jgi:hypothetical protein
MLINFIEREENKNEMLVILGKLLEQWEKITAQNDYECLKALYDTMENKKEALSSEPIFEEIRNKIIGYIERVILQGKISFYFDYFINVFEKSTLDVNVYLGKIFTDGNATPYSISAFFKFFKEYLFYFNINLEQYSSNNQLTKKIINSLKMIDSTISLVTLKDIYLSGERRIKIEVLQAMQNLTVSDNKFLLPILKEKDLRLRAEAFVILIKDKEIRDSVLKTLFSLPSLFGLRNIRLIENIKIVEQKEIKEAQTYLEALSKRKNFWNKKLRNKAKQVLEKWDVE